MNQRATVALDLAVITLMSFWSSGLQAPIQQSNETTPNTIIRQKSGTYHVEMPLTSCPNYERGNPSLRDMTGCETGSALEVVDHEKAFGFHADENPDWSACGIPHVPDKKSVQFVAFLKFHCLVHLNETNTFGILYMFQ